MSVTVHKYHGLGNDFVLAREGAFGPELVPAVCDRHYGLGADGVIFWSLGAPGDGFDVRMTIYNKDGSRPQMCGNGVRCLVRMFADEGLSDGVEVGVMSDAGLRDCVLVGDDVRVGMGLAEFGEAGAPFEWGGESHDYANVSMGNPHAVVFAQPDLETIDAVGARANAADQRFPEGVNVEFVRELDGVFHVVVYERGVGRTLACGTGACAVAAAAWSQGRAPDGAPVKVRLPGGPLLLERSASGQVLMTGPARKVYTAQLDAAWLSHEVTNSQGGGA